MKWALVAPEYSVDRKMKILQKFTCACLFSMSIVICELMLLFVSITLFAFATVVHEVLFFLYKYLWI